MLLFSAGMRSDTLPTNGDYFGPPDIGGPPCTRSQVTVRPPPEVEYSNLFKNYNHERDAHKYKRVYTRRISDITPESVALRRLSHATGDDSKNRNASGGNFDDIEDVTDDEETNKSSKQSRKQNVQSSSSECYSSRIKKTSWKYMKE